MFSKPIDLGQAVNLALGWDLLKKRPLFQGAFFVFMD